MSKVFNMVGGGGGPAASIFVTGLSETDTVTATKGSKTIHGKWINNRAVECDELPILTGENDACSAEFSSGAISEPVWQAFDGNTHSSCYLSSVSYPCYLIYDLGSARIKPDSFYGYAEHAWNYAGEGTGTFTVQLQGSNDGVVWDNISDEVVWNDPGRCWHKSSAGDEVDIVTQVTTEKYYSKFRLAILASTTTNSFQKYCRVFTFQVTGQSYTSGFEISPIRELGTWTVTATDGTDTVTQDVLIDVITNYEIEMTYKPVGALYWLGDECEDITGGWTNSGYTNNSVDMRGGEKRSKSLYFANTGTDNYVGFGTVNTVNLNSINGIKVEVVSGSFGGYDALLLTKSKTNYATSANEVKELRLTDTGTFALDVSEITTSVYIMLRCGSGTTLEIGKVWLE